MNILPLTFTKRFVTYHQIKREGNVAIYSYSAPKEPDKVRGYETVVIVPHDAYVIHGNLVEAGESYPGDSAFGRTGWSYLKLENALDKMSEVQQTLVMRAEKKATKVKETHV
jgi:hypothetical protein